jgi:hypothetical protein
MSRMARVATAVALVTVATSVWVVGRPTSAEAQAHSDDGTPPRYQLSVLESASQPRQPQWVVLDTRTGAMELWLPANGGFDVTRLQFAGATGATRHVAIPEPSR